MDWFPKFNPFAQLPILEDQGELITDSLAILEYLCNQYDLSEVWLPKEPVKRAKVMAWLGYANSHIHLGLTRVYMADHFKVPLDRKAAGEVAQASLDLVENSLTDQPWLCGGDISLADIAVYPYIERVNKTQLTYQDKPNITKWVAQIQNSRWYVA